MVSHKIVPGFGKKTAGTLAFKIELSEFILNSIKLSRPTKREDSTTALDGTPSSLVGFGPLPFRSKSIRKC